MKTCKHCGNVVDDDVLICIHCGFEIPEEEKEKPKLIKVETQSTTDLIDFPILSFALGILSLIIPIYLFSILAIKLSKRPAKPSFIPLSKLGNIFGYIGLFISTIFIGFIVYLFLK
ncbi:MAG TPA: zinc-ribbon domain-containing protein [Acholeplasmataceae bacterium]|nr:zinc-ribbon domain-containing protein [Acholeplasmataceae bacterium]